VRAGPMFQGFQFPKTILIWFEAHPGSAGWIQAIVAGIAIVAVYLAATIPVRAEAKAREAEKRLRAWGLALLLTPEIIVLKGEIETCIDSGTIYDAPVQVRCMPAYRKYIRHRYWPLNKSFHAQMRG
jgi:hypothetical protein